MRAMRPSRIVANCAMWATSFCPAVKEPAFRATVPIQVTRVFSGAIGIETLSGGISSWPSGAARREIASGARGKEPALVGEDDELCAVVCVHLRHDPIHMSL